MTEWIIILLIIFCIIVWNYSQSVAQYSLSQMKELQIPMQLSTVWEEKKPIVISEIKTRAIWMADGLRQTRFWGAQPIWEEYEKNPERSLVQNRAQELTWAEILGVGQMENDTLMRWFRLSEFIFSTRTEAHIGPEGLRQTYGWATTFACTDGEARCILIHSAQRARLPPGWKGLFWRDATVTHHPLWTQVQYIEVLLRPGTTLIVPPHWTVAIEPVDVKKPIWWVRTDIHHPISSWAQQWNERGTAKIA
jgi:hypothetical protein